MDLGIHHIWFRNQMHVLTLILTAGSPWSVPAVYTYSPYFVHTHNIHRRVIITYTLVIIIYFQKKQLSIEHAMCYLCLRHPSIGYISRTLLYQTWVCIGSKHKNIIVESEANTKQDCRRRCDMMPPYQLHQHELLSYDQVDHWLQLNLSKYIGVGEQGAVLIKPTSTASTVETNPH